MVCSGYQTDNFKIPVSGAIRRCNYILVVLFILFTESDCFTQEIGAFKFLFLFLHRKAASVKRQEN